MFASKPAKQPRMMGQTQVKRAEDGAANPHPRSDTPEGSALLTSTQVLRSPSAAPTEDSTTATPAAAAAAPLPSHPKGHKVKDLDEIWKMMDAQQYLRLTDTLTLNDVYVQPVSVEVSTSPYVNVTFKQIVIAPHIKVRDNVVAKLSIDDLMNMLYLNDCVQWNVQGMEPKPFDDWLAEKTREYIGLRGLRDSTNRSAIADFIVREDESFTFYPTLMGSCGIFFRKICYHSYKQNLDQTGGIKFINPCMIKGVAKGKKFEYILEARIVVLPANWGATTDVPESQLL